MVVLGAGPIGLLFTALLLANGKLPLDVIVSHRMPLSDVHKGIDVLRAGTGLKIILKPGE